MKCDHHMTFKELNSFVECMYFTLYIDVDIEMHSSSSILVPAESNDVKLFDHNLQRIRSVSLSTNLNKYLIGM